MLQIVAYVAKVIKLVRKYFKGNFSHQASGGSDGEFDDVDIQQLDWVEGNRKVFHKIPPPHQF